MQMMLALHPHSQIHIRTIGSGPFHLMGDSDLLLQAILNLLDNSIKYSHPPAQVDIGIENKGDILSISVADRGIGIPEEEIDRIFERLYMVDKSHSRSLGGSGLGLSIVDRIIEKHQGSIQVTSQLGQGSTFWILLPIREETESSVEY
jgi:signal transduction histidine kinase